MPWQPRLYPDDWEALATKCKEAAGWKCEECGVENGAERIGEKSGKAYRVRLSAAHVDHDPANPEPRLIALCEVCHLRYDRFEHGANGKMTKAKKRFEAILASGQMLLFERGEN